MSTLMSTFNAYAPSTTPIAENAQQDAQKLWLCTLVTAPKDKNVQKTLNDILNLLNFLNASAGMLLETPIA